MKIRTDFVTNSSSYSSAVIRIQSKELSDLIRSYQTQYENLFGEYPEMRIEDDCVVVDKNDVADGWQYVPQVLDDLIESLLDGLEGECEVTAAFKKMRKEIRCRERELTDSIRSAHWEYHEDICEEEVMKANIRYDYERGAEGVLGKNGEYDEEREGYDEEREEEFDGDEE